MRTLFNILGPLTNPAKVKRQVLGVFSADLVEPLAHVLLALGSEHAMVVHADEGLDEISIAGSTQVAELRDGEIKTYRISPEDFGMTVQSLDGLSVDSAEASAALIRGALSGSNDPAAKKAAAIITLNAVATINVSGIASTMAQGVAMADDLLDSGQAKEKLKAFVNFTQLMSTQES